MVDTDGKGDQFHSCFVDPALPDDLQSYLRPCQPSTNDCPLDWVNDDVRTKCLSYTSFVYTPQEIYRNIHCAICNGIQPEELTCNSPGMLSFRKLPIDSREFNPSAFALLFDLKDNDGNGIVGKEKSCLDGQLYDPFSRKCRTVYCSQPGTFYREGRCYGLPANPLSEAGTSTTVSVDDELSAAVTDVNAVIFPKQLDTKGHYTEERSNSSVTQLPEILLTVADASATTTTMENEGVQTTTTTIRNLIIPLNMTNDDQSSTEKNFTSCPKFLLSEDEVEWLENGTLYVPSHEKPYEVGHYEKSKDGILICAEGLTMVSKFDPILGWVTVAGLGLSEVCLALHLIAFIISPDLRNLSGRNLASLSLALFAAYGSFITAQFVPTGGNICVGVALCTFYFFLSAFWWTSVLAWDVWRTIRLATVQLRCSSSGQQWGKFILYSMYAWLLPGLIVAAAVAVEYVDTDTFSWVPTEYRPFFGRNVCWFGQRKAILIYFATPLAVILSINLLLFISSAYMIRSTTAKSPTSSNQSSSRKQLGLYVRLALIMGLSWIAGLIAGAADFMPLWYVFVALCSLQGVFILLAYTCNPKVARSIRNRILVCRKTKGRQSTYRTALVGGPDLRRLGKGGKGKVEARDSHDSQISQTSQTSLTKTSSTTTP
jgi:hypothetical protein